MREYGIDLMERIDGMSWRRFSALARNLSPFGAAAGSVMPALLSQGGTQLYHRVFFSPKGPMMYGAGSSAPTRYVPGVRCRKMASPF